MVLNFQLEFPTRRKHFLYISIDSAENENNGENLDEYLNTLHYIPNGLPTHKLQLKIGIIILLRKLNLNEGL